MARKPKNDAETPETTVENPPVRCAFTKMENPQDLRPHPENPNFHPKKQLELYVQILKYQGWRRPITVSNRSKCIVKGHGARQAAILAGFSEVPVDYQDYDSAEAEIADLLADNQLAQEAELNKDKIGELMHDFEEQKFNIDLTGFTRESLADLLKEPKKKPKKPKNGDDEHPRFILSVLCENSEDRKELFAELHERGFSVIMAGSEKIAENR